MCHFCHNLKHVTLNEGLMVLDNYMFALTDIESVVLPSTLRKIGESTFCWC